MISVVDPQSRHVHKTRSHRQDGYKAHLAIEPETGLFTAVSLRPGTGAAHHEATVALELLDTEDTPVQVLADTAYSAGDTRPAASRGPRRFHPGRLRHRHHHHHGDLSRRAHRRTVGLRRTAPPAQSQLRRPVHRLPTAPTMHQGQDRPHRDDPPPPRSAGRRSPSGRHRHHLAGHLPAVAATVERAVAWIVARGNRRLRHRGTIAGNAWLHTRAAALSLRRLINLGLTYTNSTWTLNPTSH